MTCFSSVQKGCKILQKKKKKKKKNFIPTCFEDLVILNCMYRPGQWNIFQLSSGQKHSKKAVKYIIPCMEKYLHNTYGTIVYQEQIMMLSLIDRQLIEVRATC